MATSLSYIYSRRYVLNQSEPHPLRDLMPVPENSLGVFDEDVDVEVPPEGFENISDTESHIRGRYVLNRSDPHPLRDLMPVPEYSLGVFDEDEDDDVEVPPESSENISDADSDIRDENEFTELLGSPGQSPVNEDGNSRRVRRVKELKELSQLLGKRRDRDPQIAKPRAFGILVIIYLSLASYFLTVATLGCRNQSEDTYTFVTECKRYYITLIISLIILFFTVIGVYLYIKVLRIAKDTNEWVRHAVSLEERS